MAATIQTILLLLAVLAAVAVVARRGQLVHAMQKSDERDRCLSQEVQCTNSSSTVEAALAADEVEVVAGTPWLFARASFPAKQAIARQTQLELAVRNTGTHTAPDVAVTLDSFYYTENYPELAANKRPVWAIERGPGPLAKPPVESQEVSQGGGAQTAYVNTWALGPLAPGGTQTFRWELVPVKPGAHTVNFAIAAGLSGKATVHPASGGPLGGRFTVNVAPAPATTHVDPATGRVVAGAAPAIP